MPPKSNNTKKTDKTEDKKQPTKKGGAKDANDADLGSDDDYETDDQSNVDEEESRRTRDGLKSPTAGDELNEQVHDLTTTTIKPLQTVRVKALK